MSFIFLVLSLNVNAQADTDGDGIIDALDLDDDNDGILDEVECPSTFVEQSFTSSGGQTVTFNAPAADGGFQFDIYKLDNSFNLNINGIDLVPAELQCENPHWRAGQSKLVFGSDFSEFGVAGNSKIWQITGDANTPVIRVRINSNGSVSFLGKRSNTGALEKMVIRADHAQANTIAWNNSGTNTVILSQIVKGATNIQGVGSGVIACKTDTDGDGIINSLDSDSDGDGCPDAIEGGAVFKPSDLSGGSLTGSVDGNGIPVAAGTSGQSIGTSVDANAKDAECVPELIAADTLYICTGESVTINATNFDITEWTGEEPFNVVSNGTITANPSKTTTYYLSSFTKNQDVLQNGSFEQNGGTGIKNINTLPGWNTTATDNKVEIWRNGFLGHATYDGNFLAELNANQKSALYQDINTTPGAKLSWGFAHKARGNGTETVDFEVGPPGGPYVQIGRYPDTKNAWGYYQGVYEIPVGQNVTRFYFSSQDPGSSGNLLDGITFHTLDEQVDSIVVVVNELPIVNLGIDTTICNGESITLDAGPGVSYLWTTTETSKTISVGSTGAYSVDVTDINGCTGSDGIVVTSEECEPEYITQDTLTICKGDSLTITANGITTEVWSGTDSFNQVDNSTIKVSPAEPDATYYIGNSAGITRGANLITNGDFESGSTGFTSEYAEDCFASPWMQQGGYCVSTDPKQQNPYWSACGDHTSGSGNMFITDASTTPGVKVWCQNITVDPATDYEFSSWIQSVMSPNPAVLEFEINGVLLGSTLNAISTTCEWQNYAAEWNSGVVTSAEICLVNKNTNGGGNDFALDDIEFVPLISIPSSSDSIVVIVNDVPNVNLGNDTTVCVGESITLNAQNTGATYLWNESSTSQSITTNTSGTYSVKVTGANSCIGRDTIVFNDSICAETLCGGNINFNNWSESGLDTAGMWKVSADGKTVNQSINGAPTFFIGSRDYMNVKFSGKMRTDFSRDDDWIGMVFGYQSPELQSTYPLTIKTYVLGWKQSKQRDWEEGFTLFEVNTTVNNLDEFEDAFGVPFKGSTVLASNYGNGTGYTTGQDYTVSIEYTSSNLKVSVDNNLIFDVDGCFDPGRIGFYNWSQPDVTYSDFTYQFIGNIDMEDDTLCIGDSMKVAVFEGPSCNRNSYYPDGTLFDWNVKDGSEYSQNKVSHLYENAGVYDVELIVSDGTGCADTSKKQIYISEYPLVNVGNDTTICAGTEIYIDANDIEGLYKWNTGDISNKIKINSIGEYSVAITNRALCTSSDTMVLSINDLPIVNLGNDSSICEGQTVSLDAKNTGLNYSWNNGKSSQTIVASTTGVYGLVVSDEIGCIGSDSMTLTVNQLPKVILGNDTSICSGQSVTLDAKNSGLDFRWNTGSVAQTITVNSTGVYGVEVRDEIGCLGTDSMNLTVNELPVVELGNDTAICIGQAVILDAKNSGLNFSWNTNENTQSITINSTGTYGVEVRDEIGCLGSDSMNLTVNVLPVVELGNDTAICIGQAVILDAKNSGLNFSWNTNGNTQSITINSTGTYGVEVRDEIGCLGSDSMNLTVNELPVVNLGVDTTICEWDTWTLNAKNEGLSFEWNTGSISQVITAKEQGKYKVSVFDEIGCEGADSMNLFVDIVPDLYEDKEKEICQGDTIALYPTIENSLMEVYWLGATSKDDTLRAYETGQYNGMVVSSHCQDTFPVQVLVLDTPQVEALDIRDQDFYCFDFENPVLQIVGRDADIVDVTWFPGEETTHEFEPVKEGDYIYMADDGKCISRNPISFESICEGQLFLPNAFTPDGNGNNDVFKPVSFYVDEYLLVIYDRWGNKVFESTDPNIGWTGVGKTGLEYPIDVYVYKLMYSSLSGKAGSKDHSYTGTVTLVR